MPTAVFMRVRLPQSAQDRREDVPRGLTSKNNKIFRKVRSSSRRDKNLFLFKYSHCQRVYMPSGSGWQGYSRERFPDKKGDRMDEKCCETCQYWHSGMCVVVIYENGGVHRIGEKKPEDKCALWEMKK